MQIMFKEIIAGDIDAVRGRLASDAGEVGVVATGAPRKYAGQSPLQVARLRAHIFDAKTHALPSFVRAVRSSR